MTSIHLSIEYMQMLELLQENQLYLQSAELHKNHFTVFVLVCLDVRSHGELSNMDSTLLLKLPSEYKHTLRRSTALTLFSF